MRVSAAHLHFTLLNDEGIEDFDSAQRRRSGDLRDSEVFLRTTPCRRKYCAGNACNTALETLRPETGAPYPGTARTRKIVITTSAREPLFSLW